MNEAILVSAVVAVGCTAGPLLFAAIRSHERIATKVDERFNAVGERFDAFGQRITDLKDTVNLRFDGMDGRVKAAEKLCGLNGSPCAFVRTHECETCRREE